MRCMSSLSQTIEEYSRTDEGILGKCLYVVLNKTLSDRLWSPFKIICSNPVVIAIVVIVLYVVFCVVFIPLLLLSYLISSYGSTIVLLVALNYLVQMLARAIAFPGCNAAVQKQLSADFIGRIMTYLENVATATADFSATLMLIDSGRIPSTELHSSDRRLSEIVKLASGLPTVQQTFDASLSSLIASKSLTTGEQQMLSQVNMALEQFNTTLTKLSAFPPSVIVSHRTTGQKDSQSSKEVSEALNVAGQCLKACEALKIASVAAQPVKPADGEEDTSLIKKLKGILSLNDGLLGSEKASFPYMRELLRSRFKAQRMTITGSSGNSIDAMLILAAAVQMEMTPQSKRQNLSPELIKSSKGIVLFCSPNAGFYECVSQSELRQSWLGYYCVLGYDVCYFNYRGYGSSTGSPAPGCIKKDALLVARYLREHYSPTALLVHGESIGGMAACYIARHGKVDCLICDRTFASLDAVATRLLRGQWAGYGLRYLGLWQTHVVTDYLASTCPKLILQDPDDDIIANVASLKNGVATHMLLDDNTWYQHSQPQDYILAAYLNQPLPHSNEADDMIAQLRDLAQPLQERFIAHFYACVLLVAKKSNSLMNSSGRRGRRDATNEGLPQGKVVRESGGKARLTEALQNTAHTIDRINTQGSINLHDEGSTLSPIASPQQAAELTSSETTTGKPEDYCEEAQLPQFSSQKQFLEYICGLSITGRNDALTAFTRLWVLLARIDGGSGQLLGQAVRGGYDSFRAWVCSLLVWGTAGRAFSDGVLPSSRATIQRASSELSVLLTEHYNDGLSCSPVVSFLQGALEGLSARMAAPVGVELRHHFDSAVQPATSSNLCSMESNNVFNNCCEQLPATAVTQRGGRVYVHHEHDNAPFAVDSTRIEVGNVLPLHCGHNGWLAQSELGAVSQFLSTSKLG